MKNVSGRGSYWSDYNNQCIGWNINTISITCNVIGLRYNYGFKKIQYLGYSLPLQGRHS